MTIPIDAYENAAPPIRTNVPPPPRYGNAHQWVCTAIFEIPDTVVRAHNAAWMNNYEPPALNLEPGQLKSIQGPACLKCHQPFNPTIVARPCPVQVVPLLGIAT